VPSGSSSKRAASSGQKRAGGQPKRLNALNVVRSDAPLSPTMPSSRRAVRYKKRDDPLKARPVARRSK
jgi:hypothetical protein